MYAIYAYIGSNTPQLVQVIASRPAGAQHLETAGEIVHVTWPAGVGDLVTNVFISSMSKHAYRRPRYACRKLLPAEASKPR